MKTLLSTFLLIILISCEHKSPEIKKINASKKLETTFKKVENIIYKLDTIDLNNQKIVQAYDKEQLCYIIDIKGDTILKKDNCYIGSKFIDINNDNFKDIKIIINSGTPNLITTFLFNQKHKKFLKLENSYYEIFSIPNSNLYYTLERYGLCDMCWESYISKIDNYNLINLGHIIGHNNDTINLNRTFEIYKIVDEEEVLHNRIRYYQKDYPWNFFEKYINRNYKIFISKKEKNAL